MAAIDNLLTALDERQIAQRVGLRHDEARMSYHVRSNTVADFDGFTDIVADYYNYHFTRCVSRGGGLSRSQAAGRAKEILEKEYRRRNGDIVMAFNDAHDGTNGGGSGPEDGVGAWESTDSVGGFGRFSEYARVGGSAAFRSPSDSPEPP